MGITFVLLVLFHQLMTRVVYAGVSSTPPCATEPVQIQDKGTPYNSVNMYFLDSSCQPIIQQEMGNAMLNVCTEKAKRDDVIKNQNNAITAKIQALEWKINDMLDKAARLKSSVGNATCRTGYVYYQQDNFCYKFYNDCKTWLEARQVCRQDGGDLISLNDRNFNFFKQLAQSKAGTCDSVWVGTTDVYVEGQWNWLNGARVSSVSWQPDQPDNFGNSEHCGDLTKMFGYMLNDDNCVQKLHFLCQIS
ncbi:hypothetical protein ACJMK2_032060 [Sinanodonta woodiana]|uniref:C-type lectin domain-containing protein n=1 Tax=Sinanodonta woodiana TaxID=1069815 RepID=A0ABD3X0L2_SINWO